MKNKFKIIVALTIIGATIFACKKGAQEIRPDQQELAMANKSASANGLEKVNLDEQKFAMAIQVISTTTGKPENGIFIGTKEELESIFSDTTKNVYVKRVAKKNNVFAPIPGPNNPVDDYKLCQDDISRQFQESYPGLLAMANQTCTPQGICITCDPALGGLSVIFQVKPTSWRCERLVATHAPFKDFAFAVGNYDGPDVATYINEVNAK